MVAFFKQIQYKYRIEKSFDQFLNEQQLKLIDMPRDAFSFLNCIRVYFKQFESKEFSLNDMKLKLENTNSDLLKNALFFPYLDSDTNETNLNDFYLRQINEYFAKNDCFNDLIDSFVKVCYLLFDLNVFTIEWRYDRFTEVLSYGHDFESNKFMIVNYCPIITNNLKEHHFKLLVPKRTKVKYTIGQFQEYLFPNTSVFVNFNINEDSDIFFQQKCEINEVLNGSDDDISEFLQKNTNVYELKLATYIGLIAYDLNVKISLREFLVSYELKIVKISDKI